MNGCNKSGGRAGEPTRLLIYASCVGSYFIELATVHNGRGYDVYARCFVTAD